MSLRQKFLNILLAGLLAFGLAGEAYARAGGGGSFGSRGGRTFSAPSMTQTAPRGASPFERSMTSPNQGIFRPGMGAGMGARPGFFSGGFGRGLLGGFLGAGLFGLLFGHGLFGGLGSGMSFLGLLVQIGLLFLLFKLVMGFLRNRQQPAYQGADQGGQAPGNQPQGGNFGFGGGPGPGRAGVNDQPLPIETADYTAFEQKLAAIQSSFSNEDLNGLRLLTTPEMASYFAEEIAGNATKGFVNKISDVKLLQGDVAEAWREANGEYATVAMRFSLTDRMIERASGRIVSGGTPEQVTEIWTFFRPLGATPADWKLAAIQQQG
ncbi:Tim44 domain-containing protein [Beijerinckia indica]|uniref:Import inner membrane translocase subunit Tim44 n=1 Tax=Beijerinckia indica subsp. indica (strain ATCC 9039 / DSM 1715 / NCIMB 8712) TaxID=395963 RepID=B2IDD6_BEII9|nr:TIM44-like domain-containing protein [Beijerinckia indica]ACB93988.1 import inner membrane translocase subunit Tim44 [Beijerinckia indica subsp. indica ATCC 9039]